ncbi:concanavalin A-like lectin/glucanase domain-containing protein [Neurospora tetraspora]|uniref:Concanavalin A-like lectin/glucanase domain-containing protein n=1 Tax=Neurospora tetraspora TaxID=94610 RepID=A0AAE0JBI0_9PEZI|nr:concanavalin A-like lectin/glucanase domain-containing protein [Neurospora tetraspora]
MKSIHHPLPLLLKTLTILCLFPSTLASSKTLLIPSISFNSTTTFNTYWSLNYPWGTDHNGAARMSPSQVTTSSDGTTLNLTAHRVTGQKPATHGGKQIPIKYLSGAIHAKQHFTITSSSAVTGYDFSAEFRAPVAKGTWPAFWLTAVNGWPPEIDMAEWKGSGKISFNTFNTSSQVMARDVQYGSEKEWHRVVCEVRKDMRNGGSGKDVEVRFWMDGKLVVTQWGRGIINLQMEGSSGSPGPEADTLYQVRNLEVWSYGD